MTDTNEILDEDQTMNELLEDYRRHLPPEFRDTAPTALLGAVLLELKIRRESEGGPSNLDVFLEQRTGGTYNPTTTAVYAADEDQSVSVDEWTEFERDFVASEHDLRFNDGIRVAFADPADGNADVIDYDSSDSPVAGLRAHTTSVWVRAQSGTGGATVDVESWRDG